MKIVPKLTKKPADMTKGQLLQRCFTGPQEELRAWVENNYECENIEGNLVHIVEAYSPVFVAHMDTVGEKTMHKKLQLTGGVLSRPGYVLGGDDRAGVYLILRHHDEVNWILTCDEEVGGLGSAALVENKRFLQLVESYEPSCGVVLDRAGTKDIIGAPNSYCEKDLEQTIQNVLTEYTSNIGSFCDADQLNELFACVNLSVGYENAHTQRETLNTMHLQMLDGMIEKLNAELIGDPFRLPEKIYYPTSTPKYLRDSSCEICGAADATIDAYGMPLCTICAGDLMDDMAEQLRRQAWYDLEDKYAY